MKAATKQSIRYSSGLLAAVSGAILLAMAKICDMIQPSSRSSYQHHSIRDDRPLRYDSDTRCYISHFPMSNPMVKSTLSSLDVL